MIKGHAPGRCPRRRQSRLVRCRGRTAARPQSRLTCQRRILAENRCTGHSTSRHRRHRRKYRSYLCSQRRRCRLCRRSHQSWSAGHRSRQCRRHTARFRCIWGSALASKQGGQGRQGALVVAGTTAAAGHKHRHGLALEPNCSTSQKTRRAGGPNPLNVPPPPPPATRAHSQPSEHGDHIAPASPPALPWRDASAECPPYWPMTMLITVPACRSNEPHTWAPRPGRYVRCAAKPPPAPYAWNVYVPVCWICCAL